MSETLKKTLAGFIVTFVAIGMTMAPVLALDPEIEALLLALGVPQSVIDQINADSGNTTVTTKTQATGYVYTGILKHGSTGASVIALQEAMNLCWNAGLIADGAFGAKTKTAVMNAQASFGLVADGIVGPKTAPYFESCTVKTTVVVTEDDDDMDDDNDTPSSSKDVDGEGTVDNYDLASADETEALEGEEDVEIYAVDVELDDEGDLLLQRLDVWFSNSNGASDLDPWEYFESISVTVDGDVVATEDADSSSDWSDSVASSTGSNDIAASSNKQYRMRFSDIDAHFGSDDTTRIGLEVTMVNTIDSNDQSAVWNVEIGDSNGFRWEDGTGFIFTEGAGAAALEDSFTVGNEETASIDISLSSDDPDEMVIEVDDSSDTNETLIAIYNVEETEGLDVTIDTVTVELDVDNLASPTVTITAASSVIKRLHLEVDGDIVATESVTGTTLTPTVTFDNLNWDLDGDDEADVSILADFEDTNNSARYDNGVKVQVENFAITELEDENGNDEGDITTITSPGASNTHEIRDEGIMVAFDKSSFVKTTSDTTGINETVEFTLEFDVTAFGEDMWIERTCAVGTTGTDVDAVEVSLDGDTDGSSTTCTDFDTTSGADQGTHGFEVKKGTTESFAVTILGDAGEAASAGSSVTFKARINGIGFNVGTDAVGDTVYAFDLDEFESKAVTVYDR